MPKRIDVKELNETISEIVKARNIQKAKVDKNKMLEEMQEEEIAKLQRPVVEEIHKIVPAIEQSKSNNILPIENKPTPPQLLPILESKTSLSLDPDKGLDLELINYYKYFKPSELLNESNPEELIEAYITEINQKLKSYGGMIRNKKDDSDEYKLLRRKIDGLRAYKERIKQIPEALKLQRGEGIKNKKKNPIQYIHYNNVNDLFKILELLCAEKDIGNDSIEVRNEIVSIYIRFIAKTQGYFF
jgi:hypothetical protein